MKLLHPSAVTKDWQLKKSIKNKFIL
jgi:hypothetical protein